MIKGSCLCGDIEYEIEDIPGKVYNCHCSLCRKAHGAAFASQALAKGDTLKFIKGENYLKEYKSSSGGIRAFCSNCGSRIMNYSVNKRDYLSVAISSIDSEYQGKPVANLCVDSKANWYEIKDDLPKFKGIPENILE